MLNINVENNYVAYFPILNYIICCMFNLSFFYELTMSDDKTPTPPPAPVSPPAPQPIIPPILEKPRYDSI